MTENKRFTITGDRSISDHHKKRLYDLSDFDGMISVTECLNELADENEQLTNELNTYKEANKLLKQTIDRLLTDNIQYKTKLNEQMKKEYKKNE
jgi:hypothetical protein